MSCLQYLCLFGSSLPSVVCMKTHVLFTLFVCVWFFFTFSCLYEDSCLVYVICVCLYMYIVVVSILFVGGHMSYLPYLCLLVHVYSGGIYFVCRRAHVLFTFFEFR